MPEKQSERELPCLLNKLGKMTAIRDSYQLEQCLLRMLGELAGVSETSLYRIDDHGSVIRAQHRARAIHNDVNGVQTIAEHIEEVVNDHTVDDSIRNLFENIRMLGRSYAQQFEDVFLVGYPLYDINRLSGLVVFSRGQEINFAEDVVISGVLEIFTNYYALLDTSQRDRLTGLLNRYSLELNLDRLWSLLSVRMHDVSDHEKRREAAPQSYWLGMFDIDHFKTINDAYGHVIGDEVLIMTARLLESSFRRSDLLYRYGGEEFIAIIAANDLESATQGFERARNRIEQFLYPQVGKMTISGGFSGADPSISPQQVINHADSALYEAKRAGRNRIYHYDTLVSTGVLKEVGSGTIDLF